MKKIYSKKKILSEIKKAEKKLGKTPSRAKFMKLTGIAEFYVLKHFKTWSEAVSAAGFKPHTFTTKSISKPVLLRQWAIVVRKLQKVPSASEYRRVGKHPTCLFEKQFGLWSDIPEHFRKFAMKSNKYDDVLKILEQKRSRATGFTGNPLNYGCFINEPTTKKGVMIFFGSVAEKLGYSIESITNSFPECEATIKKGKKGKKVGIEFEHKSKNFYKHQHPPEKCDVIVCWEHNWEECPGHIKVVELKKII